MKYTKEDVIMCKSKAKELRLKIDMQVAVGDELGIVLLNARNGRFMKLIDVNFCRTHPFTVEENGEEIPYTFCIIKKEPKYAPYDLSKKEDRDELRGKWIRNNEWEDEYIIEYFMSAKNNGEGRWVIGGNYDGHDLLTKFTFVDTGLPVGKPVIEEEKEC